MWDCPLAAPSQIVTHCLQMPEAGEWTQILKGALSEVLRHGNFEEVAGSLDVDTTIAYLQTIYDSIERCFVMQPGDVFQSYRSISDGTALACDGSTYLKTSYPKLATALNGITFSDASNFAVPDFRSRAPIGTGQGSGLSLRSLDQGGGAETHSLTASENGQHSHSVHQHVTALAQLGVGELVSIPFVTSGSTGDSGSGDAHNNMPPFRAVNFYIVTGE